MRVLATLTLSVIIVIGGPIVLFLSPAHGVQLTENENEVLVLPTHDGCSFEGYAETPPCTLGEYIIK
jgi:hypothetical protein